MSIRDTFNKHLWWELLGAVLVGVLFHLFFPTHYFLSPHPFQKLFYLNGVMILAFLMAVFEGIHYTTLWITTNHYNEWVGLLRKSKHFYQVSRDTLSPLVWLRILFVYVLCVGLFPSIEKFMSGFSFLTPILISIVLIRMRRSLWVFRSVFKIATKTTPLPPYLKKE